MLIQLLSLFLSILPLMMGALFLQIVHRLKDKVRITQIWGLRQLWEVQEEIVGLRVGGSEAVAEVKERKGGRKELRRSGLIWT